MPMHADIAAYTANSDGLRHRANAAHKRRSIKLFSTRFRSACPEGDRWGNEADGKRRTRDQGGAGGISAPGISASGDYRGAYAHRGQAGQGSHPQYFRPRPARPDRCAPTAGSPYRNSPRCPHDRWQDRLVAGLEVRRPRARCAGYRSNRWSPRSKRPAIGALTGGALHF
jgi:hypothetical protein